MSEDDFEGYVGELLEEMKRFASDSGVPPEDVERCLGCGRMGVRGVSVTNEIRGEPGLEEPWHEAFWWCSDCRDSEEYWGYESK